VWLKYRGVWRKYRGEWRKKRVCGAIKAMHIALLSRPLSNVLMSPKALSDLQVGDETADSSGTWSSHRQGAGLSVTWSLWLGLAAGRRGGLVGQGGAGWGLVDGMGRGGGVVCWAESEYKPNSLCRF
jgi:hypothetical protein